MRDTIRSWWEKCGRGPAPLGVALVCVLLTVFGCEESVDPIIGSEFPFTIWGFMNAGADTQYVRVYPISDELLLNAGSSIDAQVFSTDLTTGERREWTYKTFFFDSLSAGHIYWSPFHAEHKHRYRLEVVRSDGAISSAEVAVPAAVKFEMTLAENQIIFPIRIIGDAPNLVGPKVTYRAINIPPSNAWPPGTPIYPAVLHHVTIPYEKALTREPDGWRLTINIVRDTVDVRSEFRGSCLITSAQGSAPNIWVWDVEFTAVAADSAWNPPGGVFDPDILAVPGTLSNVENGYGFFGAGVGIRHRWEPDIDALERAGYSFAGRCGSPPGALPVPQCMNPPIPCIGENVEDVWQLWLR